MFGTTNTLNRCILSGNSTGFNNYCCYYYSKVLLHNTNKRQELIVKNTLLLGTIKYLSSSFVRYNPIVNNNNSNVMTLRNQNCHYTSNYYYSTSSSSSSFKDKLKEEANKLTGFNMVTSFPLAAGGVTRINKKWMTKKKKKPSNQKQDYFNMKQVSPETYQHLCERFPQLLELDENEVRSCMIEGAVYGFSPSSVSKMLCRYPELLYNYQNLFPNSSKAWRLLGFSERERMLMFLKNPQLMGVSFTTVAKGYGFLSHYFSSKELVILIKNNPECLVDSDVALREKIESLWKSYSHSTLSIAQSEAISRDMNQITVRHEFLIRAGLLKVLPHRKFLKLQAEEDTRRVTKIRDKYFTPNEIVCSSDEKFLNVCTKNDLTLEELACFEEIFNHEQEQKILDETHESDSDEEEDEGRGNKLILSKNVSNSSQNTNIGVNDEYNDDDDDDDQADCIDPNPVSYYIRNSHGFFHPVDEVEFYY